MQHIRLPEPFSEQLQEAPLAPTLAPESKVKQIGFIYGIYRILIGVFLILGNYIASTAIRLKITQSPNPISPNIEYFLLSGYLVFAIVALIIFYILHNNVRRQLMIGFFVDMVILTLLLYSGAAKDLQIVLLYTIAIAASFMMLKLHHAVAVAFVAILSLIFQQVYHNYANVSGFLSLSDTILLCFSLLAVGFLSFSVSQRLAATEQLAYENAKEAERLSAINEEVIKNMTSGIIVIGQTGRLRLINHTAEQMLRLSTTYKSANHTAYIFEIERLIVKNHQALVEWYQYNSDSLVFNLTLPQQKENPAQTIRIHKKPLAESGMLLILEDLSREESYAEQLKLASLGQLSGSIAHEVRNPLGAIAQASELLMEEDKDGENYVLYEMIYKQTRRVNRIIEDIMRLSRQEPPQQELINLKNWLPHFLSQHFDNKNIATHFGEGVNIFFDPHHLEQIFVNIIDNALRHTKTLPATPDVFIRVHQSSQHILIDIMDNGEGVPKEHLSELFNPFFTKSKGGTGLGLYISRSFSEANHARLIYLSDQPKTCFRLMVPLP